MSHPPLVLVRAVRAASAAIVVVALAVPAHAQPDFTPPVDGEVSDPFRPPRSFAGPGNRGLEYAHARGRPVTASGDGLVAFAGPVAGRHVVSVVHDGAIRTTYTDVDAIAVATGDRVQQGQFLARAGERFHFGAIVAGVYVDPAGLFGPDRSSGASSVRLVPPQRLGGR